jgi:S-(hydroxymethyl)glutathione dehydrogenase/alcohol dehydrogenase
MSEEQKQEEATEKESSSSKVSRRDLLKTSAIAVAGTVGTSSISSNTAQAQTSNSSAIPDDMGGRKFRAWIHREIAEGNTGTLEEITMLPIGGRQVVVRTEATQCCYSNVGLMLGEPNVVPFGGAPGQAVIQGHGGVGIVEAVGPEVKRVNVGDRVVLGVTPQCGECYNCLRNRGDLCYALGGAALVIGHTEDGVEVVQATNIGGHAELMITLEEWCVAVESERPSAELSLLSCVGSTGLGTTMTLSPITPGASVAIFGAGPIGLSAVQGARIQGASQIIVVEPVRARREMALQLGATTVFDPNDYVTDAASRNPNRPFGTPDPLMDAIRELCEGGFDSLFAGDQLKQGQFFAPGPDFVIEAVGGDRFPVAEPGPDPTGRLPLRQAWEVTGFGSALLTVGVNHGEDLALPGSFWANCGRNHFPSQYGGTQLKRDIPRYARLIDSGLFDAGSLVTTFPLEQTPEAFRATADRTVISAVLVMN